MISKHVLRLALLHSGVIVMMAATASMAGADYFHGLNAGAPVWGGNVLLTPQKAQQFAATGTQTIRVNFRLDSGATSWNSTQLAMYDQVITNAHNAGLEVLGLFSNETVAGGQGAWNNDPNNDGFNTYVSDYADTAELLVNRYGSNIKRWELWNEPNSWTNPNYASDPQNAGGTYILPRVYARMLSETYRALDSANLLGPQGATLMSGGLLAHDIGGSFSTAMDYMQQVYNQGDIWNAMQNDFGRRYPWDEFGYHFYISQGSLVTSASIANYFNAVRAGQASNNDPADVAVTEFGWQTVGSNTQQLQRDNMATSYDYLESQPYVTSTYWYQWIDEPGGNWGIVDGAGQPKLSYQEFAARNSSPPGSNVVFTTQHAATDAGLGYAYSNSDLIQGKIPTVLPGDLGWHPANPAATNPNDPNGLPAFTDGVGDIGSGVTGLLNDYPTAGAPAKLIRYDLGAPHDIDEIRIFTGNLGNDGRIYSTTAVWTSTDGVVFDFLGYFQSDISGSTNNAGTPGGPQGATLVRIVREDGSPLAEDATHIRFHLFAVSDLGGIMMDPFDGVNPFTGNNDGFVAPYVSPLVREIDVFGTLALLPGDFNGDGSVDAADYVVWRKNDGTSAAYAEWRANFGSSTVVGSAVNTSAAVPETSSIFLLLIAAGASMTRTNARMSRRS
ncbi:MAG: hypothetical protein IT425_14950 [Pirellulales bacterium]|nr:hypothetical protein [Pirellulales bacterium]